MKVQARLGLPTSLRSASPQLQEKNLLWYLAFFGDPDAWAMLGSRQVVLAQVLPLQWLMAPVMKMQDLDHKSAVLFMMCSEEYSTCCVQNVRRLGRFWSFTRTKHAAVISAADAIYLC